MLMRGRRTQGRGVGQHSAERAKRDHQKNIAEGGWRPYPAGAALALILDGGYDSLCSPVKRLRQV